MKKLMLVLSLFFFVSSTYAVHVKIEKKDGGLCGYKKVTETHTANGHDLICSDPGNEKCIWEYPPKLVDGKTAQNIIEIIERQISNGFRGGSLFIETLNIRVQVSEVRFSTDGIASYVAEFDF